jgi:hypothetical protein
LPISDEFRAGLRSITEVKSRDDQCTSLVNFFAPDPNAALSCGQGYTNVMPEVVHFHGFVPLELRERERASSAPALFQDPLQYPIKSFFRTLRLYPEVDIVADTSCWAE